MAPSTTMTRMDTDAAGNWILPLHRTDMILDDQFAASPALKPYEAETSFNTVEMVDHRPASAVLWPAHLSPATFIRVC